MSRNAKERATKIREIAGDAPVAVGLILGSGLGHLAGAVEGVAIPYDEFEGLPHAGVPEVILGRFPGLRCAAISTITNMAVGMSDEPISHEHTKAMAPLSAAKPELVLRAALPHI